MCPEWANSFPAFLKDMGDRPVGMTLDRINPERGYERGNCRWATPAVQGANKRSNVIWRGSRTTITQIAADVGVPRTSLNKLIKKGLPLEAAVAHAVAHRKA